MGRQTSMRAFAAAYKSAPFSCRLAIIRAKVKLATFRVSDHCDNSSSSPSAPNIMVQELKAAKVSSMIINMTAFSATMPVLVCTLMPADIWGVESTLQAQKRCAGL